MKTCPLCLGSIKVIAKPGRTSPYKGRDAVPIPDDFKLPTCDKCGAEWIDAEIGERLDEAL